MAVTLRLSRIGKKHVPFYRIVAVDSRNKRDGAFLDDLGTYDAVNSKLVSFKVDSFDAWLSKGAQVSDAVKRLHKLYVKEAASKKAAPKKSAKSAQKKSVATEEKTVDAADNAS